MSLRTWTRIRGGLLAAAITWAAWVAACGASFAQPIPDEYANLLPDHFRQQIARLSTNPMLLKARTLGIREVLGKSIDAIHQTGAPSRSKSPARDVLIGADPLKSETEPHVAMNPTRATHLVAAMHSSLGPTYCVAQTSFDGGLTWSPQVQMPHLATASTCSDPVLAFSPDGSRIYYAYMDIKNLMSGMPPDPPTITMDLDIVVSHSDNGGLTWSSPVVALDGTPTTIVFQPPPLPPIITPGSDYDKPWIAASIDAAERDWVYVTATRFPQVYPYVSEIAFVSSSTRGESWSAPLTLDVGAGDVPPFGATVVQGSRPAGGMGGSVLVAWYHSNGPGTRPGWGLPEPFDPVGYLSNSFLIRTRYSADHGAHFGPTVNAAVDEFEVPPYLGPLLSFFRYTCAMFPDVKLARDGSAHIVYTHDPARNTAPGCPPDVPCPQYLSTTPEDGDIRYIASAAPPYIRWSAPLTLNDDRLVRAQAFPSVAIEEGPLPRLIVTWLDTRLSPLSNVLYDLFGTTRPMNAALPWAPNFRISEESSMNDYTFIGDYFGLAAGRDLVYQVWTDRRHQRESFILAGEDNVMGSRIVGR